MMLCRCPCCEKGREMGSTVITEAEGKAIWKRYLRKREETLKRLYDNALEAKEK